MRQRKPSLGFESIISGLEPLIKKESSHRRLSPELQDLAVLLPGKLRLHLDNEEEAIVLDAIRTFSVDPDAYPVSKRALAVAAAAHRGQQRKGSGRPFIVHPVGVARLLVEAGCGDEIVAAGLLHDTLEDTRLTLEDLHRFFGETVAATVAGCSEPDKSVPWKTRKLHTLQTLRKAPHEVRLVTCADKLDNVLSLVEDEREQGEALWGRFNRGRDDQAWYYRSIVQSLSMGEECFEPCTELLSELQAAVESLFGPF
jgi:(p)ppGpp synthase/HD superfamily hydrolase